MSNTEFKDIKCNFNLYKSFYAVAVTGSFSEAARSLYVSQPSLSYNVKQLEEQLNTNLFYRRINGVSLTKEGEKLLEYIGNAFDSILQAEEMIGNYNNSKDQSLIIGAPTHIANFYLINLIDDICKKHPEIRIKVIEKTSSSLKELLQKDMVDIVFDTSFSNLDTSLMEVKEIGKEECCFAAIPEVMNNCQTIEELSKLPFVLYNVGGNSRKKVDEYFTNYGLKITPRIEAYTTETILSLVREGLGVGFFYRKSINKFLKKGELVEFHATDESFNSTLSCAYLKDNTNTVLSMILSELENMEGIK